MDSFRILIGCSNIGRHTALFYMKASLMGIKSKGTTLGLHSFRISFQLLLKFGQWECQIRLGWQSSFPGHLQASSFYLSQSHANGERRADGKPRANPFTYIGPSASKWTHHDWEAGDGDHFMPSA